MAIIRLTISLLNCFAVGIGLYDTMVTAVSTTSFNALYILLVHFILTRNMRPAKIKSTKNDLGVNKSQRKKRAREREEQRQLNFS